MKPSHTRFCRPNIRHDHLGESNGLDTGNVNTQEGFDAHLDLAHARYTARVTGGMWTWDGEKLVRITAPEVVHRESREEHIKRLAKRINPDGGPDPQGCAIPGCPWVRGRDWVICRNHVTQWRSAGKPSFHIWLPAMVEKANRKRKAGAA